MSGALHHYKPTPTELESLERRRAFRAKCAELAAKVVVPEDRTYSIPNTPFGVPKVRPEPVQKIIFVSPPAPPPPSERFWFSIVGQNGEPSITEVKLAVCEYFNVTMVDLASPCREKRVTVPRMVAIYLCRELTTKSLPQICRCFGNRDHTTGIHSHRRIRLAILEDDHLARAICELRERLT